MIVWKSPGRRKLLSPECKIRYIITVNALKEGWDCPFAYILASLTNKSSKVDVEQILGRILRQPYARRNRSSLLNLSYVLTCSANFQATLEEIVTALNKCGFSRRDYRVAEETVPVNEPHQNLQGEQMHIDETDPASETDDFADIHPEQVRDALRHGDGSFVLPEESHSNPDKRI